MTGSLRNWARALQGCAQNEFNSCILNKNSDIPLDERGCTYFQSLLTNVRDCGEITGCLEPEDCQRAKDLIVEYAAYANESCSLSCTKSITNIIIGVVVGAVALLGLAIGLYFLKRKRSAKVETLPLDAGKDQERVKMEEQKIQPEIELEPTLGNEGIPHAVAQSSSAFSDSGQVVFTRKEDKQ